MHPIITLYQQYRDATAGGIKRWSIRANGESAHLSASGNSFKKQSALILWWELPANAKWELTTNAKYGLF